MNSDKSTSEEFLLSAGGPFHNALVKMHLNDSPRKLAFAVLSITWLPLAIITAFEGTLYSGVELPFLKDITMQARILVALPILMIIKIAIDNKVITVAKYITDSLISQEKNQVVFNTAVRRAKRLSSSALTEIILLFIVISATYSVVKSGATITLESETTSWIGSVHEGESALSIAGYWAVFVSLPMFQFLLLRWLWRYFVWMLLLFRLSKSGLSLLPTHSDRSGGLGIIMHAQKGFIFIFFAGSVVISGQFITQLNKNPELFNTIRSEIIAYIVISLILIILPLLFFTGQLVKLKNNGLLHLSRLGATLSRKFENEWVNNTEIEKELGEKQVDPSMIYDYLGIYDGLQQLRVVPATIRDVVGLAVILFIPFIPILFIHFSVAELLQRIASLLK